MTPRRDSEARLTPDERAPLLAQSNVRRGSSTLSEQGDSSPEGQKVGSKKWRYVWRGILVVLAILVIALFVKGWIDADDVDVGDIKAQRAITEFPITDTTEV